MKLLKSGKLGNGKKSEVKARSLLDQVEICDRNGQHDLDISSLNISAWPNETVLVQSIRILNAEKNKLAVIPSLDHFKGLTELNLSRNSIEDISEVHFGSIVALRSINLSRNALTSLPADITRLTLLEELNVSYNRLSVLPEAMFQLRSLTSLDASHNQLVDIGDSLESLSLLVSLNLMGNDELNVDELSIRTRRLHEKRVLLSSKDSRKALIRRALGIQKRVQTQEQTAILAAMATEQTTGVYNNVDSYP